MEVISVILILVWVFFFFAVVHNWMNLIDLIRLKKYLLAVLLSISLSVIGAVTLSIPFLFFDKTLITIILLCIFIPTSIIQITRPLHKLQHIPDRIFKKPRRIGKPIIHTNTKVTQTNLDSKNE